MAKRKKLDMSGDFLTKLRKKLGMNQQQFWSPLGVTQSGGSRYESGRGMPRPVRLLVYLFYVNPSMDTGTLQVAYDVTC